MRGVAQRRAKPSDCAGAQRCLAVGQPPDRATGGVDMDEAEIGLGAATGLTEGASGGLMTAPGAAPAAMADASEDDDTAIGRDR